jgi:hypothetical protein
VDRFRPSAPVVSVRRRLLASLSWATRPSTGDEYHSGVSLGVANAFDTLRAFASGAILAVGVSVIQLSRNYHGTTRLGNHTEREVSGDKGAHDRK